MERLSNRYEEEAEAAVKTLANGLRLCRRRCA